MLLIFFLSLHAAIHLEVGSGTSLLQPAVDEQPWNTILKYFCILMLSVLWRDKTRVINGKKWKHEKCGLAEKKNIEKVIKFPSLIKIDYFEYHFSNWKSTLKRFFQTSIDLSRLELFSKKRRLTVRRRRSQTPPGFVEPKTKSKIRSKSRRLRLRHEQHLAGKFNTVSADSVAWRDPMSFRWERHEKRNNFAFQQNFYRRQRG